jgi:hypothetical protein
MKTIARHAVTVAGVALLLFLTFGFLATFEPLPAAVQWTWRIIYGAAAMLDAVGLFLLWRPSGKVIAGTVAGLLLLLAVFVGLVIYLDWGARHGAPL